MTDVVRIYDRIAGHYDRAHARWLRHAGGAAQAAIDGALAVCLRPGMRVLDAGCGSGAMARRLVAELGGDLELTLVDPSAAMLAQAVNLPARRYLGGLEQAPLEDESFDLVLCCWAVEACPDPGRTIRELVRVLAPGGTLLVAFCAEKTCTNPVARVMKRRIQSSGAGRFLCPGWVRERFEAARGLEIREVPCAGPAAAFAVRKSIGLSEAA